ncbi:DUF6760 family protein [Actinoplanes sp. NPDC051346]|uniref:DUF6760 family protein n=1 Tax=Actinoplanes sp. NPDC051346 TaxID=3155048 RepID=UPI0034120C75
MRHGIRGGRGRVPAGGILTYAPERLWEEVAYVANHLHWSFDSILDLEHPHRARLLAEIGRLRRATAPAL